MNLNKLLKPTSVAVIGASEKEGFGGDVCRNILSYVEDRSHVYFIHPKRDSVFGVPCYKSISDVPENVDLMIICTSQKTVIPLLQEGAKKGVGGAVVFASGYGEVGTAEGKQNEAELIAAAKELDIAVMGPNCAGFVNYVDNVQAFAFISAKRDRKGSVGVVSQSGQLCLSMMDDPGMRFSYNISAGNGKIVQMEDYMDFLVDDEEDYEDEYEDDYEDDEDLYEERKKFLYAEYPKIEQYLQDKSSEGYHFVRQEGKKYFFRKGQPKTYYYSMNYFVDEPDADQWREWESDGWKLVSKADGKKKSDAGWFTFRNEEEDGEYRKEIDNDSEKFRFFKKYSSSCRSTMFLVFICMACCVVTGLLQVYFQGYLAGIALCAGLFLISFIVFCMYGRMLRKSKKRARELKSKLRIRESRAIEESKDFYDTSESEEELDTDWNTLEQHTGKEKKHLFRRVDREDDDEDEE